LREGDRVLFIGDTFFEREVDYGHIETRLTARFASKSVLFRNLAWSADTPVGVSRASFDWNKGEDFMLARVKEQLALVKPTVAFLSYGTTAALTGPSAIPKYRSDLVRLMAAIDEVSGTKVRFVLLGPIGAQSFKGGSADLNPLMKQVEDVTRSLALEQGAAFVPLTGAWLGARSYPLKTEDGIHLTETGYETVAGLIEAGLCGGTSPLPSPAVDVLRDAVRRKNELFFNRWRPENWTYLFGFRKNEQGQNAVEIPKFEPLIAEWEARIAKVRDLNHQDATTIAEIRAHSASVAHPSAVAQTKPQPIPTFEVADGFEVNLWSENPQLHKPIEMNWDAQGRLWIASSEVYPQIKPGQPASDSVVVLEDTDGDGRADKSTIFASGLLIPTGVLPDSAGGCYVAASHQLLHFKDLDGDGKSDQKRIILTSFGTEDTHHNLHTLRWGYDGHMYFNQSIYTHTHIETPFGVVRLNSGGIWRFDPLTWHAEVFCKGGCNPWGHHWDQWGNHFFTDGAGGKGIYHAMEGATYFTYSDMRREADSISPGNYPKFASLEVVHSPNFPEDWQANAITCDFRAHRVVRFAMNDVGSSFQTKEMPDLLRSTNVTFRPIDVRFGPDGALYIADWSNPIIQHGEVDFRDPRRDKEHGRIWRVTAKGRPLVNTAKLRAAAKTVEQIARGDTPGQTRLPVAMLPTRKIAGELFDELLSPNTFNQESARRLLVILGPDVLPLADHWAAKSSDPRARLEAVWLHSAFNRESEAFLLGLAGSSDARLRTAAARQLSH
jgi:glucose/arabinose dehydrogenase